MQQLGNQIHVPQDYNTDLTPSNQLMKEKFFESLGLPPDLSYESVQKFQYQNQNQPENYQEQIQNNSRMNTLKQNEDDLDSQMFKSCLDGNSPIGQKQSVSQSKHNVQQKGNTQYQTSQNSYRTAFNGTNGINGNIEKQSMRSQLPQSQHGTFTQNQNRENEALTNIDMMFMDSQRKTSAPTAIRQPFNLGSHDQMSQQFISDGFGDTMQRNNQRDNTLTSGGLNIKELLTITVEIGDGQQENILIKENDDPYLLAASFSRKHGIGDQLRDLLAEQIRFNIEQVMEDREGGGQQNYQYAQNEEEAPDMYSQEDQQQENDRQFQQYLSQEQQQQVRRSTNNNSFGNNMFQQQNPLFPPQYNLHEQAKYDEGGNKSFAQDRSSYINNQSFLTDRSKGGANKMMQNFAGAPISIKQYRQFQDQLQSKDKTHQPAINQNSKKIIETKRGASESGRKKVHDRLHQQALSKQKASILRSRANGNNNNDLSQLNQSQKSIRGGGAGSNQSTPSKIDNSQNPIGQYQMLQRLDQNQQKHRSSSQQNQRNPAPGQQQINSGNMSTLSGSQLSQRPAQILNYGERLYQKGLKRKEEFERNLREAKSEQERQHYQEYSFQPHINDVSRQMNRPNNERAEDSLINYGKTVREKIEQKRSELAYQEINECKFHPAITKKSERIMSERMGGAPNSGINANGDSYRIDKFNTLYEDARRRQERQDKIYSACMEAECTFQPDTNQTRCYNSKLENRDPNQIVFERLNSIQNNSKERNSLSQIDDMGKGMAYASGASKSNINLNNDLFDQDTGQPYFHPKVGRGPKLQHRPSPTNGNVGSMLYEQGCFLKEKQDIKKKALQDQQKQKQNTVFTKDNTNRIMERIKLQKFAEIFKVLDSDSDGQISAQRIDISQLNPELLEVLTPLFCEMEEMAQTLNEEEFLDACGRLYDSVSLPEKNIILQNKQGLEKKQKSGQLDLSFKPQINANSQRIAAKSRPNGDVADLLIQRKQEYEQKIKEKQQEKENSELIGCTFHPKILYSPSSANSENASNRSRVFSSNNQRNQQQQQYLMLNNSQSSLQNNTDYINIPNMSNQQQQSKGNKNNYNNFDINNLAHNIASDLLKQQQFNTAVNIKNIEGGQGQYIPNSYQGYSNQQQLYSGQSSSASGKTVSVNPINNNDLIQFSYQQNKADSRRQLPLSQQGKWPPQYKDKFELTQSKGMIETPLSCKGPSLENQSINWHQQPEANGFIITTPQSNYTQLSTSVRQSTAPKRDDDNMSRFGGGMSKIFSENGANSSQLNCSQEIGAKQIMDGSEEETQDLVMSRSDWFQCLKVAYSQLEQNTNEGIQEVETDNQKTSYKTIGVDKEQLISMIEINLNQLPLQSLKDYIGQSVVRKEKWISLAHVLESINKIETQLSVKKGKLQREEQENIIFWDDIIDSLLVVTLNNNRSSLAIDSNNISEIYSSEAAFSIGAAVNNKNNNLQQLENQAQIHQINNDIGKAVIQEQSQIYQAQQQIQQKQSQSNQVNSFKQEILKQGKKLVLKDSSILLDLSRVEDSHNSKSIQEIIQYFVVKDQQHNLRGMSLARLSLTMLASQYLNISNMNGLVILNLSTMVNINLEQELPKINLLNLQFLNISNNSLQQINFSNHNFPKLKEIYANNNKFTTAKSFAKLDSIKLLDLEDNLIEDYEELVCLAFLQNMIVLSLKGNPISGFHDFEMNMKKILSKITLLNPDCIKKVSCFENFKELAFGSGVKSQTNISDSQLSQYNDVPKRTVNINIENAKSKDVLIQKYNVGAPIQIEQTTTVSQQSTPNKQTQYNVHTKRYFLKREESPVKGQIVNQNKSPSKVVLSQKMVQQFQQQQRNEIYESINVQKKLECPQALPIKNDSLKYFNKLSRKGDDENNIPSKGGASIYSMSLETENDREMKQQNHPSSNNIHAPNQNVNVSQSTFDKRDDHSISKPPRCIKIRPSPSIQTNSSQSQIFHPRSVSGYDQNNRGIQNSTQTLIMDSSQVTDTEAAGLQTPKYNRREVQSQQIQPFLPFQNNQNDQYQDSLRRAQDQRAQNNIQLEDNNQSKNDVARYYERSISQMNINKIREMASKEVCKVSDQHIKGNMSPINAMMILQPPTVQQQQEQQDNRNSLVNKGERNAYQLTPKQSKITQSSNSKNNSTVRRRSEMSNKSKNATPKAIRNNNVSIPQMSNQNQTQTFSFNKLGNQDQRLRSKQGHPPHSKSKSSLLKNSSRNKKLNQNGLSIDKNRTQGTSYEVISYKNGGGHSGRSSNDREDSSFVKGINQYNGSRLNDVNKTQHPVTNRDGQFSTPFQNYINNIVDMTSKESERDSIRPFRLPPRESPSLYKKHSQLIGKENDVNKSDHSYQQNTVHYQQNFVDRRHSNIVLMPQQHDNLSQEDRINQLKTTEKKKDYSYSNGNNNIGHQEKRKRQHQNYYLNDPDQDQDNDECHDDHINTPRFSDRNKDSNKEQKYQVAMKRITSKRQKQEDKKQLYNSIKGNHRQSLSSTTSNKAIDQHTLKQSGRDSSNSNSIHMNHLQQNPSKTHIQNDNYSRVSSSSNCLKLNIDLRKNR